MKYYTINELAHYLESHSFSKVIYDSANQTGYIRGNTPRVVASFPTALVLPDKRWFMAKSLSNKMEIHNAIEATIDDSDSMVGSVISIFFADKRAEKGVGKVTLLCL